MIRKIGKFAHQKGAKAKKEIIKAGLGLRGQAKDITGRGIQNLFHATVQKTASQWIKALFSDERIIDKTGLAVYPQHRYEWTEFHTRFPKYTFVPGLYITYQSYEEIKKPDNYKTFYVVRDPRDTVLSWYHSMKDTHGLMGKVPRHRENLKDLSFEEGLKYCIKEYHLKFAFMRSWAYHSDDPNVLIVKFENITQQPTKGFKTIFDHCGLDVSKDYLESVLQDYTKEKMRQRDLSKRESEKSHYRNKETDWRKAFTEEHKELFYDITGDLVDLLGYGN